MRMCKKSIMLAFCGLALLTKPTSALVYFDFTEVPGTFSQVTEAISNLEAAKNQLTQMTEGLKAIGDTRQLISQFAPEFSSMGPLASNTIKTLDNSLETQIAAQEELEKTTNSVNVAQKRIAEGLVEQIEKGMKIASSQSTNYIQLAQNDIKSLEIEEEEEEENIDVKELQDSISVVFEKTQKESAMLTVGLNDVFDETINVMNKSAEINDKNLEKLSSRLNHMRENVDEVKKKEMQEKLQELISREQKVSDMGINIAEKAKSKYNRYCQENITDGLKNYEKVVLAYAEGNVSKEEVLKAGALLKDLSSETYADENLLAEYKAEISAVREDAAKLAEDISNLLISTEQKS